MNKNRKRGIIIAVFAFLAVLFVSTIGSSLTGFVVLNKDPTLAEWPYPFIKNSACNRLYLILPDRYDANAYRLASQISNSLKKETKNLLVKSQVCAKTATRTSLPIGDNNIIAIGNPCTNSLVGDVLKAKSCSIESLGLQSDEGLIQIINNRRSSTLILSGNIEKAAAVITNHHLYPLKGNKIIVSGPKNSLKLTYVTETSN